jgi:hypothetical protein
LARAGQSPHVLLDSLRCLAARGLTTPDLFTSPVNKRQLLALKEAYDAGRRALRSARVATNIEPAAAANLLLLWLGALPEPLFPAEHIPELLQSHTNPNATRAERVASMRCLLKRTEPFIVEALFPLFELLHHYWINQPHRESTLATLSSTFAMHVFGTPSEHGASPEAAIFLQDAAALLITEYRPLFTQPYNLQRYEADLARQASAAEAKATAAETRAAQELQNNNTIATGGSMSRLSPLRISSSPLSMSPPMHAINGLGQSNSLDWAEVGSPLLTPRRMGALSVMEPAEPLSLGCSPDENSPLWSLFLASTLTPINTSGTSVSPLSTGAFKNTNTASNTATNEDMEMLLDGMLESTVSAAFGGAASAASTAAVAVPYYPEMVLKTGEEHKNSPVSIFLGGERDGSRETSTEASASPCDMLSDSSDCDADLPQAQTLVAAAARACAQLQGTTAC